MSATNPRKPNAVLDVPPLESGDVLTREEFERRYAAMPELKKAELVEGVVFLGSPVHIQRHAVPHSMIITWLGTYWGATPGTQVGDNGTVRLDLANEFQPDAWLRVEESRGGQSRLSTDDYLEGAPELVVEIAGSSASHDLHAKLRVYERNGVQEYIVWLVHERRILWYRLRGGGLVPLEPGADAILRSETFPGLWLDAPALLSGDLARVLRVVQQGMAQAKPEAQASHRA